MDNSQTAPARFAPSGEGIIIDGMKILSALWKNLLIIILAALIGGSVMLGYSWLFVKPEYTASVLAYINKSTVSLSGTELVLGNAESAVATYNTILNSRTTLEEIAQTAGLPYSAAKLGNMIKASAGVSGTSFLTIEVTSGTPKEAELIANTIASVLPVRVSDIVEGSTLRVVDYAVIPSARSTAPLTRDFMIGLAVGALVVCAVVAVRVIIETNYAPMIDSSEILVKAYPEYPVLGVINDMSVSAKKFKYSTYGSYSGYYTNAGDENRKSSGRKGGI